MKKLYCWLLAPLLIGCKQRYEAPAKLPDTGYLVIEGVVHNGNDTTIIKLSRTTKLNNRTVQSEKGALIEIHGKDNSVYMLTEKAAGEYRADHLDLDKNQQYLLEIKTADGRKYRSEYVPVIANPPIDSISWLQENGGLQLNVSTHNPLNNTRYYQWEYVETWEINSQYFSSMKYQIQQFPTYQIYDVVFRKPLTHDKDSSIYYCWQYHKSGNLLLRSTARQTQDIINLPLVFIPHASRHLSVLYSIDVKQYGWSKTGYEYLEGMKKNTESIGSVFDAQPSQLTGNIHNVNDQTEPVIGFFNISPLQEKRIFLRNIDFSDWGYKTDCSQIKIVNSSDSIKRDGIGLVPVEGFTFNGLIVEFWAAKEDCVDCTLVGSNIKPYYWPR
jgi:Domain of unknown function (DUF4249)